MAQLCGQEPQAVIDVLKADDMIYLNPLKTSEDNPIEGWEETSEYLSGNVREKLRTAELYAKDNPRISAERGGSDVRFTAETRSWRCIRPYRCFLG